MNKQLKDKIKKAKIRREVNKAFSSMSALEKSYFGVYGKSWVARMTADGLK